MTGRLWFGLGLGAAVWGASVCPAVAQDAISVYRPTQYVWSDGASGAVGNSLGSYLAAVNQIFASQYAACQSSARANGNGSCSTRVFAGADPYTSGSPFEVYYNGQAWWNWLAFTAVYWGISNNNENTTTSSVSNGSSGDYPVYVDAICPAGMNKLSPLVSGPRPDARYYDVTCKDPAESACPTCTIGSVNNKANVPLIGNPINPATFEKFQYETDYVAEEGRLAVTRQYRSLLGNWVDPFPRLLDFSSLRPVGFPAVSRTIVASANGVTYLPIAFDLAPSGSGSEVDVSRRDGTRLKLSEGTPGAFVAMSGSASASRATVNGIASWIVNTPGNTLEVYGQADGRLIQVAYLDGYVLDYAYPQANVITVTSRLSGRSLRYQLGDESTIAQVTLPAALTLQYQGTAGVYTSVQYPDTKVTSYVYDEAAYTGSSTSLPRGQLTGLFDELGVRVATYQYNSYGQAISTERAGGVNKYQFANLTVTDPLGTQTNMWWYPAPDGTSRKSMVHEAAGSGSPAANANYAYDASGNLSYFVDFRGNMTCYLSDATRNLETVRVEGVTSINCSSVTPTGSAIPPGARKISRQWHPDWRFEVKRAEAGKLTTFVYNGQPDPFNGGSTANCAPVTALLPGGKPIAVVCKQVEQATTDGDGHLGFAATLQSGVPNRTSAWTYNGYGQVLTAKGARTDVNDTTTFLYYTNTSFSGTDPNAVGHTIGDLQRVTNALGKITNFTSYNKHGQLLSATDPNGVVNARTYDLRQRPLTSAVGGQTTTYGYDAAGQVLKVTAPDASWLGYEYDAAHRVTAVKDNLGNRIEYTLDAAGNRTVESTKDPFGILVRQLSRTIDPLGRVQQLTGRE